MVRPLTWKLFAAVLACSSLLPLREASACTGSLAGRALVLGADVQGFGGVQKQTALKLDAGEYVVTIDDGPNPKTTPALLDALKARCVKATFFLIGRNAEAHPDLVRRIEAEGHGIGNHSFSHPNLSKLTDKQVEDEIANGGEAIEVASGASPGKGVPRLFRFPGSIGPSPVPPARLVAMVNRRGLVVAGYDLSPQDWRNSPPQESFKKLFNGIKDRGVIVFHDGQSNTLALLPMALDELQRRGASVVALSTKS